MISRSRHRTRQSGQAILETAFTLLPLIAMIALILDVSLVIFLKGVFQNATREGVRWAITYSPTYNSMSCGSQTACIKQVVQDNSVGFLAGAAAQGYISVNYYAPFDLSHPLTGPVAATATTPKIDFVNQTGNVIEVNISNFPWNWMVPLASYAPGVGLKLSASSSDILQGYPAGTFAPPAP